MNASTVTSNNRLGTEYYSLFKNVSLRVAMNKVYGSESHHYKMFRPLRLHAPKGGFPRVKGCSSC